VTMEHCAVVGGHDERRVRRRRRVLGHCGRHTGHTVRLVMRLRDQFSRLRRCRRQYKVSVPHRRVLKHTADRPTLCPDLDRVKIRAL
jgi:hypothetical protein